jgi:hypothetical protein
MDERLAHRAHGQFLDRPAVEVDETGDATHQRASIS